MAKSSQITVELVGDASKLSKALSKGQKDVSGFGDKAAKAGKIAAIGLAAVGGAVAGATVAAFKIGQEFDKAFDKIRVGTGATGDALSSLQEDFREVVRTVPASFADASSAIADINTRLGLTGKPLRDVSARMLELSNITGEDLNQNIEGLTRTFGDWGVAVEDMPGSLDKLFRASQATGISVGKLGEQMVKYGAPARQLGFTFEQTAGLLGKFEKEGVNAELVMGSMRQALGRMARAGEPAVETFARVTEQIKSAGSASEANAIALELFGARAGPDMAAAIREGRFELGDLLTTIESGQETILGAAEDTRSWQESWELLKNNGMLLFEPVAERVFDKLSDFAQWLIDEGVPAVESFAEEWGPRLQDWFTRTGETISRWWEDTVKPAVREFTKAIDDNWPRIEAIWEDLGEVVANVGRIFRTELEDMGETSGSESNSISDNVGDVITILETLAETAARVSDAVAGSWNFLSGALQGDNEQIQRGMDDLTGGALTRFRDATLDVTKRIVEWWEDMRHGIGEQTRLLMTYVAGIPDRLVAALGDLRDRLVGAGKDLIKGLVMGIKSSRVSIWDAFNPFGDGPGIGAVDMGGRWRGQPPQVQKMMGIINSAHPGTSLISGLRPGAITSTGNPSYHGKGRAVDFKPSRAIAEFINRNFFGRTKELITPWQDLNIHNGRRHSYSPGIMALHTGRMAHNHWAMASGAYWQRPVSFDRVTMAERHPEFVAPEPMLDKVVRRAVRAEGGGDGASITIQNLYIQCDNAHDMVRQLQGLRVAARAGG